MNRRTSGTAEATVIITATEEATITITAASTAAIIPTIIRITTLVGTVLPTMAAVADTLTSLITAALLEVTRTFTIPTTTAERCFAAQSVRITSLLSRRR